MGFLGILEQVLLNESASIENVTRAMDNNSKVIINYRSNGEDNHTGVRIIEPVAYGLTKSGNPVIRAWQPYGDTTTKTPGWKFFRLDRISYWEETQAKFGEVPDFKDKGLNPDGDDTMSTVIKTYNSTKRSDATNGMNVGPKTKEKVLARSNANKQQPELFQTQGDKSLELAKNNVQRILGQQKGFNAQPISQQNGNGVKVDFDNNKKADNGVNTIQTSATNTTGPKMTDQITNNDVTTTNDTGDINQEELDAARQMVQQPEPEPEMFKTQGDRQLELGKSNLERMKNQMIEK